MARAGRFASPSGVYKSYPRVYVAIKKHSNYPGRQRCNTAGPINYDDCTDNVDRGRIRVWRTHNIGGYEHQSINCVGSQNAKYYANETTECFWGGTNAFRGWQANSGEGGAVHSYYLMSYAYECWMYNAGNCYYGP
jgi:hypothetical protein